MNMSRRTCAAAAAFLFLALLARFPASLAGAQESGQGGGINTDIDSLFGGDEVVENQPAAQGSAAAAGAAGANPAAAASANPVTAALKSNTVRVGGTFYGSLSPTAYWTDLWSGASSLGDPDKTPLLESLKSTVFFDARPAEDLRVYGSVKGSLVNSIYADTVSASYSLFELFADVNLNDKVYFRFGKSTVKWGVGYFWSPADVINLEQINILDAEAQREGPINFRVNIPVPGTQDNFYFYTILDKDSISFDTTALAAKFEFLLGNYEFGLGAYYRNDTAERAMLTLTGPLGDFDVFGEAMLSRGSAKTFVESISPTGTISTLSSSDERSRLYCSASAGFLYNNQNSYVTAIGQYYYNGEGYSSDDRASLISQAKTAIAYAALHAPQNMSAMTSALSSLVSGSGRHYAALSVSKSELFTEDLSVSAIAVANLSDWSGLVKPAIDWKVTDYLKLELSPIFIFGSADGEYSLGGDLAYISLGAIVSASF